MCGRQSNSILSGADAQCVVIFLHGVIIIHFIMLLFTAKSCSSSSCISSLTFLDGSPSQLICIGMSISMLPHGYACTQTTKRSTPAEMREGSRQWSSLFSDLRKEVDDIYDVNGSGLSARWVEASPRRALSSAPLCAV